jgi:cellulose synthase/poly-beta-1,6-N-acetylglucosamine synthase-like glycosyltransferase
MTKEASVIIPAFNEEAGIGPLLDKMQKLGLLEKYEVIVVDDGSLIELQKSFHLFMFNLLNMELIKVMALH